MGKVWIDLKFKIPNPEYVKEVRQTYKLHFLNNYKNVAPSETLLVYTIHHWSIH